MTDCDSIDLKHHFLIAMPGLEDETFAGSVIYMCEHGPRGAMGLIINKPADISMSLLFDKVDLRLRREDLVQNPVGHGGPVQTERGFVLHDPLRMDKPEEDGGSIYASTLIVPGGLEMTTSRDVLEALNTTPELRTAFNENPYIPQKALNNLQRDSEWSKRWGATNEAIDNARKIIGEGPGWIDRLERALKSGAVLPAIGAALLSPEVLRRAASGREE
jgi:putative AlgH/UPF0301 family transcriptional regulator